MDETTTHFKVPITDPVRQVCLGPDGSVAHVTRTMRMLKGRWKLAILFRLFADPSLRTSQLKQDMPGISQKVLTQHLRELEKDGLIERVDFGQKQLHVEYNLSRIGKELLPVLVAMREFSANHPS